LGDGKAQEPNGAQRCTTSVRFKREAVTAVLLLALCGCNTTTDRETPAPGTSATCDVTPPSTFVGGNGRAIVGGDLAYLGSTTWRLNTDEKGPWLWRTSDKTQRLRLQAERLDARTKDLTFDLGPAQELPRATADAPTFAPEWGSNMGYGGYVGLGGPKLPELGCWRLSVVGGNSDDAIVVRVGPAS
jgi:hypothetical protein